MFNIVETLKVLSPRSHALKLVSPYVTTAKPVTGKTDFNTKHLKRGDPLPPYNGKLRLYNMRFCLYAQRTVLALNAKNIDYEVVNINLAEKPEWLTRKSPFGKVPSIEIKEDVCVYESLVTVEYLDEVYPYRPLLAKDPLRKALDKIIVEASMPISSLFIKSVKAPKSVTDNNLSAYNNSLEYIQSQLKARGTVYLGGNEPGYVDYVLWPLFERILALSGEDTRLKIHEEKFPLLITYSENMLNDPVVKQYLVPKEIMIEFHKACTQGMTPNYELLNNV